MISYKQKIASLKADTLSEAMGLCIPVKDADDRFLGKLVPIGKWVENTPDTIEQICGWRNSAQKMFPTQTIATPTSTMAYIKRSSVESETGILFAIFDNQDRFVGHIGVTDVGEDQFELAHLIKGINDTDPKLIFNSEACLMDWGFNVLGCQKAVVEIMSYNWIVSMMHKELGFETAASYPLKKIETDSGLQHQIVSPDEANVKYTVVRMEVENSRFYESLNRLSGAKSKENKQFHE